jgi:GntR family transcriptional regulator, transcriptional repressor for pyruvate dehydrogenase complex
VPPFRPIEQRRAHEYVAEQIRRQIGLRLLRAGTALPPERELATTFSVGKATVEAAVRLLEAERLVETRRGRHGGIFVLDGGADGDRGELIERLRRDAGRVREALELREAVEPLAARLAAQRRDDTDLGRIAQATGRAAEAADDAAFMAADAELHLAIAAAGRNGLVADAVETVRLLLRDPLAALPESELWRARSLAEHALVVEAIAGGRAEAAAAAMAAHAATTARSIEALLRAV